jgi:hypothetical protein
MNEILQWNIKKEKLVDYKAESWTEDYFIASPNNEFGIFVYNIEEWRMLAYGGIIGIYSNPENPNIELNSSRTWIWFQDDKTFDFLEKSDCIACRKPAYNSNNTKGDFPFLLINIKQRKFGFIEFDGTSIYYGLEEIEKNKAKIIEVYSKDLDNLNIEKRTNEIINLDKLKWFDLIDFGRALEKYRQ